MYALASLRGLYRGGARGPPLTVDEEAGGVRETARGLVGGATRVVARVLQAGLVDDQRPLAGDDEVDVALHVQLHVVLLPEHLKHPATTRDETPETPSHNA